MEHYQTLIGVVLEKLNQTHQELKFNLDGLNGVLAGHTAEEIAAAPELLTIRELRDVYADIVAAAEKRFPGLKG